MPYYKPNSPESFAVCRRIRDQLRAQKGFLTNPVTQLPEKHKRKLKRKKPKRGTSLPADKILEVYRLLDEGVPGKTIAEKVGTSQSTVWRVVKKRNIDD